MSNDIVIDFDNQGYPLGYSGRAKNKAEMREQFRRLRQLGVQ